MYRTLLNRETDRRTSESYIPKNFVCGGYSNRCKTLKTVNYCRVPHICISVKKNGILNFELNLFQISYVIFSQPYPILIKYYKITYL